MNLDTKLRKRADEGNPVRVGIIGAGKWSFHAKFTGILNDQLKGFYRSFWEDDKGNQHTIATTQFEATDARRAFPCWDEPEFKATFKVTLVVDENLTAISNGRVVSSEVVESAKYLHGDAAKAAPKKVKVVELLSMLIARGNPRGVMLAQLAQSWTNVGRMFVW